jgi:hypothetical protein
MSPRRRFRGEGIEENGRILECRSHAATINRRKIMTSATQKKKPYAPMILMGVISATLYATLLTQQDIINKYFTLGGLFAFLPIATALLFSLVHGNFTGSFWTVLGVEASKKKKEVK